MRPITQVDDLGKVTRRKTLRIGRGCPKQAYSSMKLAKAIAKQQAKLTGEPIEAFHCWACHCAHIGHPRGWRKAQLEVAP